MLASILKALGAADPAIVFTTSFAATTIAYDVGLTEAQKLRALLAVKPVKKGLLGSSNRANNLDRVNDFKDTNDAIKELAPRVLTAALHLIHEDLGQTDPEISHTLYEAAMMLETAFAAFHSDDRILKEIVGGVDRWSTRSKDSAPETYLFQVCSWRWFDQRLLAVVGWAPRSRQLNRL
jgi:hypothetical protein